MTKICSKCGEEKPATTEYFGKMKSSKDGLRGQCKVCISEYLKQYRKKNKESIQQYKKQWHQENKEYIKEYSKQYRQENKDSIKEYSKQYYKQYYEENKEYYREYNKQYRQENKEYIKEYIKEYSKQYRKENKESIQQYNKQYRQENKESRRQHYKTYKARKRLLPATLTIKQWQQIKDDFNNECAYCGMTEEEHRKRFNEPLHQEHFIPLSEGGEYTHNNIIPACRSCNCSKQDTDFFEWYPTYEYYNEEREQFILEYLGYIEDTQQQALL